MTTTHRDDQWRHWLREHARAFVISGEPLWAEMLTVLADSGGPEDTGPITLTSQSDRARVPMTSPPEDVYEAAARACLSVAPGSIRTADLGTVKGMAQGNALLRTAVDSAYAAGVAAGRAQAAADIRAANKGLTCSTACLSERCDCAAVEVIEEAATIAGGEPRG